MWATCLLFLITSNKNISMYNWFKFNIYQIYLISLFSLKRGFSRYITQEKLRKRQIVFENACKWPSDGHIFWQYLVIAGYVFLRHWISGMQLCLTENLFFMILYLKWYIGPRIKKITRVKKKDICFTIEFEVEILVSAFENIVQPVFSKVGRLQVFDFACKHGKWKASRRFPIRSINLLTWLSATSF